MVIYFSGTGNTRYVAELMAKMLGDETRDMKKLIREGKRVKFYSDLPYVICAPIYAWRYPVLVEGFLQNSDFWGSNEMYFVATCADSTGTAAKPLMKICSGKGMIFMGFAGVRMPENYLVMFNPPDEEECRKIYRNANNDVAEIVNTMNRGQQITDRYSSLRSRASSLMNPWFYGAVVTDKKFRATDKCIGCGRCAGVCPFHSIIMKDGRPVWAGNKCIHCMDCISGCPTGAIEFGKKTVGRRRYYCTRKPKITLR